MTAITLPRAVVEQALHVAENAGYPLALIKVLRAALAQQAEPVEPVAWMCPEDPERETAFNWKAGHCENCGKQRIPLYTAPLQRKPLTEEEIEACRQQGYDHDGLHSPFSFREAARAIEHAHGITDPQVADRLARHGTPMPGDPK